MDISILSRLRALQCALFLIFWLTLSGSVLAQADAEDEEPWDVNYPNFPVNQIALQYGIMTGQNVIQDSALQSATLTIQTLQPLPLVEAAQFIEKSLLLNGYALIPAGQNSVKIVAVPDRAPGSEGVPIFSEYDDLPNTDQIVAFVLKFDHLGSEEAATKLTEIFPAHTYGTVVPFPQASSVVITDNTAVIRKYIELRDHLDVPAEGVEIEFRDFILERADAENVAEAVSELLGLESGGSGAGPDGGARPTPTAQTTQNPNGIQRAVLAADNSDMQRVEPKIRADSRTNSLVAIGEKKDLDYIARIVKFLDAPAARRKFLKRPLKFMTVSTFLPIARDALMPGLEVEGDSGDIAGGEAAVNDQASNTSGGGIGGSFGSTGSSSSFGSGGRSSSLGSAQFTSDVGPQSVVIGKTLLIADNVHNTLLASGPEEHLFILEELLDELDQRPRQIQISAVIAQLTLGNDLQYGADLFRSVDQSQFEERFAGVLRQRTGTTPEIPSLTDVASFLPAAQGLTLYGQVDDLVNVYLDALHTKNRFRILARPTVYTLNNRWAAISTGQRIAVPSSTLSTIDPNNVNQAAVSSSISFEEVLLQVRVLPLINSQDEVTLLIEQVNDDIIGSQNISGNDIPTIGTQQMFTTVMVPNGGTVLLGGLISQDNRKTDNGLPIMVSLPLIGPVFGSQRQKDRQELLIFIQPRIIEQETQLANAQTDFTSRSEFAEEVLEFAAPQVTSESKPKNILKRFLQLRPRAPFKEEEETSEPMDSIFLKPEIED
ncbi:MAG: secretin N-terminal domain-containing protein [Verrucomicrobiota bacterium]